MASQKRPFRAAERLCDSLSEDDGLPPDRWQIDRARRHPERKALQLCKQIRGCVQFFLEHECRDEELSGLAVVDVAVARGASHVNVTLGVQRPAGEGTADRSTRADLERRLGVCAPAIRREIAQVIARKRVPALSFRVVPLDPEVAE